MSKPIRGLLALSLNNPVRPAIERALLSAMAINRIHTPPVAFDALVNHFLGTEIDVTEGSETVFNLEVAMQQARFVMSLIDILKKRSDLVCTLSLNGCDESPEGLGRADMCVSFHGPGVVADFSPPDADPTNGG